MNTCRSIFSRAATLAVRITAFAAVAFAAVALAAVALAVTACQNPLAARLQTKVLAYQGGQTTKELSAFSIPALASAEVLMDQAANTIVAILPAGTASLSSLIASFTVTDGLTVYVGGTAQVSGATANDFSKAISYEVRAADGTRRAYTVRAVVRLAAPSLNSPAKDGSVATLAPTFTWETVAGAKGFRVLVATELSFATPVLSVDSTSTIRALSGLDTEALKDGTSYYWKVAALDAEGIRGEYSAPFAFTLTVPQPGVPPVGGASPVNSARPTWTWTVPTGSTDIRYQLDGDMDTLWISAGTDITAFSPTTDLSEGDHTLNVQARSEVGVWSDKGKRTISVDMTPPAAPVLSGTTPTNDRQPTWTWTLPADAAGQRLQLDSQASADWTTFDEATTTSWKPSADLPEGPHTLCLQANDAAGNWSQSGSFTIGVDITPPAPPTVAGSTPTSDTMPTWSWTIPIDAAGIRRQLDGETSGGWTIATIETLSYAPTTALPSGSHTLYVQARDVAGNWSTSGGKAIVIDTTTPATWAGSTSAGSWSYFKSVAVDSAGNSYAVGNIDGNGTYTFGTGVSVNGSLAEIGSDNNPGNPVIVKYSPTGAALWARSVTGSTHECGFNAVAVDTGGNIYVAGYAMSGAGCDFGNGIALGSSMGTGWNGILVKYNAAGVAQWVSHANSGGASLYSCLALASNGNIITGGWVYGNLATDFGGSVSVQGPASAATHVLFVIYNASGTALRAQTLYPGGGPDYSGVNALAIDNQGNILVAGNLVGPGIYRFSATVSTSAIAGATNMYLAKFSAAGVPLWARSVQSAPGGSNFLSLAADSANAVYVGGTLAVGGSYSFGSGVSVAPAHAGSNFILAKYSAAGDILWARSLVGDGDTGLTAMTLGALDSMLVAGSMRTQALFSLGSGVTVQGNRDGSNSFLAGYDSLGNAMWARSVATGPNGTRLVSLTRSASGTLTGVGWLGGTTPDYFGPTATAMGSSSANTSGLIVQY